MQTLPGPLCSRRHFGFLCFKHTGHGHPRIREAVAKHVEASGLMAQFSFASEIRIELAERLTSLAPDHCNKAYFWTVGSEAIECALRLAREHGQKRSPEKFHVLTHEADYHGWTLGAHQMSGTSAKKGWLPTPDAAIHHVPFPRIPGEPSTEVDWSSFLDTNVARLAESGIGPEQICAVFIETLQGWGAVPLPVDYVQALRRWADTHDILLIFDEVQTGFARTGKLFAHEHYGVRGDLLCIGKGMSSTLPVAAVLGPAEILDLIGPAEITTTHAAHPVSCAAALANLDVIEDENLIEESVRKGEIAERELLALRDRFPDHIADVEGLGLLRGIHIRNPKTGELDPGLARDWTWAGVKHGVLFQVNRPSIKVCPPLVIEDEAIVEGIRALGDALESLQSTVLKVAWAFCQFCSARHQRRSFNVEPQARTSVAELAMNHRDIAATLGVVSKAPQRPNFRLRLNVKRLCAASAGGELASEFCALFLGRAVAETEDYMRDSADSSHDSGLNIDALPILRAEFDARSVISGHISFCGVNTAPNVCRERPIWTPD